MSALPAAVHAAVRAELSKIRSSRTIWLVAGAMLALHTLIGVANIPNTSAAVAGITPDGLIEIFVGERRPAVAALTELLVAGSLQIVILFFPLLAAVVAGQEFRPGQLATSVLAVPRRGLLTAARAIALALLTAVMTALVALISGASMYTSVKDWKPGVVIGRDALAGHGKLLLLAILVALISAAITTVARSTLIGIAVSVLLLTLTMTQVLARTAPAADALLPPSAGRNLMFDPAVADLTSSAAQAVVVLVMWTVLTTPAAGWTLSRRDAR